MLDDDDGQAGDAAAHRHDVGHQMARLLVGHARGGLVEQDQARPADQRAADLDPPPVDHRQAGGRLIDAIGKIGIEDLHQLARLLRAARQLVGEGAAPREIEHRARG